MKTLEARRAIVEPLLHSTMVQTKPMKPGTCKNRVIDGCCTSYEFQIDNLSYRGVWISTIEDISLRVDGKDIPKSNMMFFCNGIGYSIPNMVTHTENFWNCLDTAVLRVYQVGGLSSGDHTFELTIKKRMDFGHSYGDGLNGYDTAIEFHTPEIIHDTCVYTI